MAAKQKPAGKARQNVSAARLPTKRSINLVLIDEKQVNPIKAIVGVLLVVAVVFGGAKFLVLDRLTDKSAAASRAKQLQQQLEITQAQIEKYGEVEAQYAHYTYEDMTSEELGNVDREEVVNIISNIIREQDNLFDMKAYVPRLEALVEEMAQSGSPREGLSNFQRSVLALGTEVANYREQVLSWNAKGNVLEVELTGKTLENLNKLARKVENNPCVDSCTLTTANKAAKVQTLTSLPSAVRGKFQVYLMQPAEEEVAEN